MNKLKTAGCIYP